MDFLLTHPFKILNQIDNQTFEISIPALTSEIESFSGILRLDSQGYQVKEALEISTPTMSLFSAIIFAMLGGLILNLMPCVFL